MKEDKHAVCTHIHMHASAKQAVHVCRGFESHLSSSFFIFYGKGVVQVSCIVLFDLCRSKSVHAYTHDNSRA